MANELIMVKFPLLKIGRKWFEPRSFLPCWNLVFRVEAVLRRLLLVTGVSTWLWRWLSLRMSTWLWGWLAVRILKHQSLPTVRLRTPLTVTVKFHRGMKEWKIKLIVLVGHQCWIAKGKWSMPALWSFHDGKISRQQMSLGTGALKVGRGPEHFRPSRGGIHGNPVSGNHPCRQVPTGTITLKPDKWKNT